MPRQLLLGTGLTIFVALGIFYSNPPVRSQEPFPDTLEAPLPSINNADPGVPGLDTPFSLPNELSDDEFSNLFPETGIRTYHCYVQFMKGKQVTLAFERPGLLIETVLHEGEQVTKDSVIAKLNDESARFAYESAKLEAGNDIDIRFGQKSKELAETELEKAKLSNEIVRNSVVEIEVLRLKLAAERAGLQLEQAQHQQKVNQLTAKEAEAQLKTHSIKAPFDGTVVKLHKFPGEAVNQGDPIIELVNIDKVRIRGMVNVDDLHKIRKGDRVNVRLRSNYTFPGSDNVLQGRLTMINLYLDESIEEVEIWAEVENEGHRLLPGMLAEMQIVPGN